MIDKNTSEILIKIFLALLGAVLGVLAKTTADVYRVRLLLPIVMGQVEQTSILCSQAFSVAESKAIGPLCEACFKALSELVALGVRPSPRWRRGAEILLAISVQVGRVSASEGSMSVGALDELRQCGRDLDAWRLER